MINEGYYYNYGWNIIRHSVRQTTLLLAIILTIRQPADRICPLVLKQILNPARGGSRYGGTSSE